MSLEFTTATRKKKKAEEVTVPFTLDGREMVATQPKDVAFLLLQAAGGSENPLRQASGLFEFFQAVLTEDDYRHIVSRAKDSEDQFDTDDLLAIYQGLLSEFSGRPTE